MQEPFIIYAYAFGVTFVLAIGLTLLVRKLALRWDILDQPGERKVHENAIPLLGGVAIVSAFYIVLVGHIAGLLFMNQFGMSWIEQNLLGFLGEGAKVKVGGVLAGPFLILVLGIIDDVRVLSPWAKLGGQSLAAFVLWWSGIRLELFVLSNPVFSMIVTMSWVILITNSLNLLDNMDGLCGGVSVIAALSFFLCVQADDNLVRLLLMIFAGAVAGFLYHNISPARIFMGDAGAMFCGYILATVAVLGTYHVEGTPSHVAVAAPLLALSVPLFDTLSVIFIRLRSGDHIMKGDKRHFSHRLVKLGMTSRQAVEFIYLVAGVVGLGAALLPQLGMQGTAIIIAQTCGVFLLIVLLMITGRNRGGESEDG